MSTGSDDAPEASTAPNEPASGDAQPTAPASDESNASSEVAAEAPKRKPQITARERAERKREEKLENVREEVKAGSLVIRQMTDEERARYPPRENAPRPKRFGGR